MPADGIPRCLSTSNGDLGHPVSKSSSQAYTIPRPFKRPILAGRGTHNRPKSVTQCTSRVKLGSRPA
jgi:hypothetical protein